MNKVSKAVTDGVLAALQAYKPSIDLGNPCPSCGKEPLPHQMMCHLFATGISTIRCAHCQEEAPLASDLDHPLSIFSTSVLEGLPKIGGARLPAGAIVKLGKQAGISEQDSPLPFEDKACADLCPPLALAKGFYDGADRRCRFGKNALVPFRHHFDILCNLKAMEMSMQTGHPLPKEETLQCFRRTVLALAMVYMGPPFKERVARQLVKNWDGVVLGMAYLRRAIAAAEHILCETTPPTIPDKEIESLLAKSNIHLVHIRAILMEVMAQFFTARFFAARGLVCGDNFRGGYEAHVLADAILNPLASLKEQLSAVSGGELSPPGFFWEYTAPPPGRTLQSFGIDIQRSDAKDELRNPVITYMRYHYRMGMAGNVKVDKDDVRVSPIGKDLSRCFIATACCQPEHSHLVTTLERFRDNVLVKNAMGRTFIRIYEKLSPRFARGIESRPLLKTIVRNLIVRPSTHIVRHWTQRDAGKTNG